MKPVTLFAKITDEYEHSWDNALVAVYGFKGSIDIAALTDDVEKDYEIMLAVGRLSCNVNYWYDKESKERGVRSRPLKQEVWVKPEPEYQTDDNGEVVFVADTNGIYEDSDGLPCSKILTGKVTPGYSKLTATFVIDVDKEEFSEIKNSDLEPVEKVAKIVVKYIETKF